MRPVVRVPVVVLAAVAALPLASPIASAQDAVELPAADHPLPAPELLTTVGVLDGPDWAQFQNIRGVAWDANGHLYVLDQGGPRIVVVDAAGERVREFGARGQGPGEMQGPYGLAVRNGVVAVSDRSRRVVIRYDTAGTFLDEMPARAERGSPGLVIGLDATGRVLALSSLLIANGSPAIVSSRGLEREPTTLPLLRYDPAHASVEAPGAVRLPPVHGSKPDQRSRAFYPSARWTPLARGLGGAADGTAWRLRILADDGSTVRVLTRPGEPRRVGAEDREWYEKELERQLEDGEIIGVGAGGNRPQRPQVESMMEATVFEPVIPRILALSGGEDLLFVRRGDGPGEERGPIDVVRADGTYLGTWPADALPDLPVAVAPDGRLAVLDKGSFDVPVVRIYRWSGGGR